MTVLAYRYEGLRWFDFDSILVRLRQRLMRETGPYHKRKASMLYASWIKLAGGQIRDAKNDVTTGSADSTALTTTTSSSSSPTQANDVFDPLYLLPLHDHTQRARAFDLLKRVPEVWRLFIIPLLPRSTSYLFNRILYNNLSYSDQSIFRLLFFPFYFLSSRLFTIS